MAHKILMKIPKMVVSGRDVSFVVTKNSKKVGELLISKGNVEWWPSGNKRKAKSMSWQKFAEYIEVHGRDIYR